MERSVKNSIGYIRKYREYSIAYDKDGKILVMTSDRRIAERFLRDYQGEIALENQIQS
jgi:hypothetical protein